MNTPQFLAHVTVDQTGTGQSHFALIEMLPGKASADTPAEQPSVPGSSLKGVLEEAWALALRGEVGRISAEQLMHEWTAFFTPEEIFAAVIPARTLARRKAKGEPLTIEETERALRFARIAAETNRVFANPTKAARWLRKPNRALNKQTPLSLLETETGARAVEELLGQIDHGIYI